MILNCGEINKHILYIIVPSIIMVLENVYFWEFEPYNHNIVLNINQAIAKCLVIIPLIIIYVMNRKLNNKYTSFKENLMNKKYSNKYKHIKLRKFLFLSLCIGLTLIFKVLHYRLLSTDHYRLSFWMFDIVFISILSLFILKVRLYNHQYFSVAMILILAIALNFINNYGKITATYIFSMIGIHIIYSLSIVMKKYVMEYTFTSVYELIFYEGFASLIFFVILFFIATKYPLNMPLDDCIFSVYNNKCYFDNFYSYYMKVNSKEVFIFLFIIFYYVIYYICFNNTIKQYTACHIYLICFFEEAVIYNMIEKIITGWRLVPNIFILILMMFSLLVFTEIIEINLFNLQYNTKRNIEKRAREITINEIEDDNNIEYEHYDFKIEMPGEHVINKT